ncbi:hypothetical protein ACNQR9_25705 [Mycolicibacterium peregrinum]
MTTEEAEPTELAGAAESDTQSAYAWGLTAPIADDDVQRSWVTPTRVTVAAVTISIALAAGVGVLAYQYMRDKPTPASVPAEQKRDPVMLDGVYKFVSDFDRVTFRGKDGGNVTNEWGHDDQDTTWVRFVTTCTAVHCIATGKQLDAQMNEMPGNPIDMRLANGTWTDMAPARSQNKCEPLSGGVATASTQSFAWSFAARPDGTFVGFTTITVETNECNDQGDTVLIPITVTRIANAA